ncbi:hypothetical protein CCH79_00005102, partial [Gambusia affinis]
IKRIKFSAMGDSSPNPLVLIGMGTSLAFSVFKPDDHLLKVLNASSHKRLQYVAVEGIVQADGEVLQSKFVPRCHGVIQKVVVEEHWKYWNYITRTWIPRTINKNETNNSVPFSLVQPGSYIADVHVKVQNPLEASGGYMDRTPRPLLASG